MTTAELVDLSLGGVGVVTVTPLSGSRSYRLVFEDGGQPVERIGRVVWNRPAVEPSNGGRRKYRVGVAFEDASVDSLSELLEFIQRHEAPEETGAISPSEDWTASRTATRYRLRDVSTLRIQAEHPYDIKNLSLSGMLIETRVPLRPDLRVALMLELPDGEVRTVGRVVSVRKASQTDRTSPFWAGIEFVEMQASDRARLEAFLQRHLN